MKNYWIVAKHRIFGSWYIEFPPISSIDALEPLKVFAHQFLEAAKRNDFLRIERLNDTMPESYLDFMFANVEQHGYVNFFNGIAQFDFGEQVFDPYMGSSLLCYYSEDGKMIKEHIYNPATILRQQRSRDIEMFGQRWMHPYVPLVIHGRKVNFHIPDDKPDFMRKPSLSIQLRTDIWFPWIDGIIERFAWEDYPERLEMGMPDIPVMYDNRELAHCHTPLLNQFLKEVREAGIAAGGKWVLEAAECRYPDIVTEDGVKLDRGANASEQ